MALHVGEEAESEPAGKGPSQLPGLPYMRSLPLLHGTRERRVPEPDRREGPDVRGDAQVGVQPAVVEAEVHVPAVQHQLEVALLLGGVPEVEPDHDAPVGEPVVEQAAVQVPHQQARVQVLPGMLGPGPLLSSPPQRLDDRAQLLASLGEVVLPVVALFGAHAPDHARLLQLLEPPREQGGRDAGEAPLQVVETVAALQQPYSEYFFQSIIGARKAI